LKEQGFFKVSLARLRPPSSKTGALLTACVPALFQPGGASAAGPRHMKQQATRDVP